jgi:hypothetical protein
MRVDACATVSAVLSVRPAIVPCRSEKGLCVRACVRTSGGAGAAQQHLVVNSKNRTKKHFGETALNCAAFRGHEMV